MLFIPVDSAANCHFSRQICFLSSIFKFEVIHHSLPMQSLQFSFTQSTSCHQVLQFLPSLKFSLSFYKSHLWHLYHPHREMTCGQAVCSSSGSVCPPLHAWLPQSLGVNYPVCCPGIRGPQPWWETPQLDTTEIFWL